MSDTPILLFLHGVTLSNNVDDGWRVRLDATLASLGYPSLNNARIIAPKYAHALRGTDDQLSVPPLTTKMPSREAAKKNRRDFESRMAGLEYLLGRHDSGAGWVLANDVISVASATPFFKQVQNYLGDNTIRAQVLHRILAKLPDSGRIVIVAHSLGSVIGSDLLRRLPPDLDVAGMITIGSPLAHGRFDVADLKSVLKDPPTHLAWWLNFWNPADPVAAHRGLSSVFPWMLDRRIQARNIAIAHNAATYLADPVVGEAIGYGLFGSKSREIVHVNNFVDTPINTAEHLALLALRFSYLVETRLDNEVRTKYRGARRHVQAVTIEELAILNARENENSPSPRPLPGPIRHLAFDLSDPNAPTPQPFPCTYLGREEAVGPFIALATQNTIRPFEIRAADKARPDAMKDLAAEAGLGSKFGADVFDALNEAREVLTNGNDTNWGKLGALGVGAAALVVATGGLALAAGGGLAGAAAITSALAGFGPGGMIGGLATAGTLMGVGGSGIGWGLASSTTTAESVEAFIVFQLAGVILRDKQQLDQDPTVWRRLTETEMELRREYERLDEFSDKSSSSLKELKRKITSVERALDYMSKHCFEPGAETESPANVARQKFPFPRRTSGSSSPQ